MSDHLRIHDWSMSFPRESSGVRASADQPVSYRQSLLVSVIVTILLFSANEFTLTPFRISVFRGKNFADLTHATFKSLGILFLHFVEIVIVLLSGLLDVFVILLGFGFSQSLSVFEIVSCVVFSSPLLLVIIAVRRGRGEAMAKRLDGWSRSVAKNMKCGRGQPIEGKHGCLLCPTPGCRLL